LAQLTRTGRAVSHLSTALTLGLHLACLLVLVVPFSWRLVALAAFGYALRMWAITAGYHRYFAHRSYRTGRLFQFGLAWLGASAMQNGPLWWASVHRRHHRDPDGPLDPHSPERGFWHAHMGWFLSGQYNGLDLSNVNDLAAHAELRFVERWSWIPIVSYAAGCFALAGLPGLVWGFAVSTIALLHATAFINSLAHVWGSRRYDTGDRSRNNGLLAVLTFGEGWHNNHHHYQSSARQGFFWWEVDVSYYILRLLAWVGVVSGLREPTATALAGPLAGPLPRALPAISSVCPVPAIPSVSPRQVRSSHG
jgi:stearoyl-CoA desaturase (delta-9 desaturase)